MLFVTRVHDCAVECVSTCPCVSFNIAVQSDPKNLGHFRCELLANDTYRVPGNFSAHAAFHHFSLLVGGNLETHNRDLRYDNEYDFDYEYDQI